MENSFLHELRQKIAGVTSSYDKLILIVSASQFELAKAFTSLLDQGDFVAINVSLELSHQLLPLNSRFRMLRSGNFLIDLVAEQGDHPVLLSNLEVLFDPALGQDPLQTLQKAARNNTVVALWQGLIDNHTLTYAEFGHPEYRYYPIQDLTLLHLDATEWPAN